MSGIADGLGIARSICPTLLAGPVVPGMSMPRPWVFDQTHLVKELEEQAGRGCAAVDSQQIWVLRHDKDPVDLAPLRAAIDGAMRDSSILEILDEVRSEEVLADPFAVDDEIDLFDH
jgi:hypothetical protein